MNQSKGFGLTELLVGLFLASLLFVLLSQCYLNTKRQYQEAEAILTTQLDLQWVTDLLANSIRRAGFTPCVSVDNLTTMDSRQFGTRLVGVHIQKQPHTVLQVNRMHEEFVALMDILSPTRIVVADSSLLNPHRPILIADCEHAEVHSILLLEKTTAGQVIVLTKPLLFTYGPSTYAGEWIEESWFIKANRSGIQALYYHNAQTEELTPLIHEMAITIKDKHIALHLGLDHGVEQLIKARVRG